MLRTNVNQQEGTVFWHDLQLNELEVAWLWKVQWVKELHLARNGFKFLRHVSGRIHVSGRGLQIFKWLLLCIKII